MIKVENKDGERNIELKGSLSEISAECILVLREVFLRVLVLFPEPTVSIGVMMNLLMKAINIGGVSKEEQELGGGE